MTPGTKRTIITSKTTGRRYFLVRSANRPNGRRYYVCTNSTCKSRVSREADLFCKIHAQEQKIENDNHADLSAQSDQIDENDIQDAEQTPTNVKRNSKIEESKENGNEHDEINGNTPIDDTSSPLSPSSHPNRQVQIDEITGARTFRDNSGRRRFLCMQTPCTNILKRQADIYCRLHTPNDQSVNSHGKKSRRIPKRHSAPPLNSTPTNRKHRLQLPLNQSIDNENQSDEFESPKKTTSQRSGTTRSFRDASGKLRFLCSISTCTSRVPRQSELYCKRHQLQATHDNSIEKKEETHQQNGDSNVHPPSPPASLEEQQIIVEPETKKRKYEPTINLSTIPANKMVIATTTLLDNQWNDILAFVRQFPQIQLSTNLNVNNFTSHLLVDDSEHPLHCTITKKIVQAAVRRHIFILSSRWLIECMNRNTFIDEHPFEIISDSHTTLRLSEQNFLHTNQFLFGSTNENSYAFAIECRQCQGSINRSELIELIQLTGAQLFQNDQAIETLIVLCDINDKNLTKIKEKYLHAPASNIKYVTSDFLLKSIIKFEIQDIEKYSL